MVVSEQNLKALTRAFESLFEDREMLGQMFLDNNTQEYAERVDEVLDEENFPISANYQNVIYEYEIDYGLLEPQEWAEKIIEDKGLDNKDVEAVKDNVNELTNFIFDNYDQLEHSITLYEEADEWADENPDSDILWLALLSQFDPYECKELIPTYDTEFYLQSLREAMGDDFPEEMDGLELEVNIVDIELATDVRTLAEVYLDEVIQEGSVKRFVQDKYHIALIQDGYVNYSVEILSDPEDFQ